jgi:hypothetical protein
MFQGIKILTECALESIHGVFADLQLRFVHELNSNAYQVPDLQAPRQAAELRLLPSSPDASQIVILLNTGLALAKMHS